MYAPPRIAERQDRPPHTNLVSVPNVAPKVLEDAYIQYALEPFLLSGIYKGERLVLPMIDVALSKENAIPVHIFGMLYENWKPDVENEGTSVFLQKYDDRGPNNERKRIYYSALTPDLYEMYADKIKRFLCQLFAQPNAGKPLMEQYYESYFDMYWDLHLGVKRDEIPNWDDIKDIGRCFINVIGKWYPMLPEVRDNYMRVRQLREALKEFIHEHVNKVKRGETRDPEKTFVHYWHKNRGDEDNPNFRDKDIIFECFHNFIAFSQWGHTLYRIMERLDEEHGDANVRWWFNKTMESDPDKVDTPPFTPLDRFVMELFRTISPNDGSISTLDPREQFFGAGYPGFSTVITPHPTTSTAYYHWDNPEDFDPDRYKTATTSEQNDETKCKEIGLAKCPFSKEAFPVKDDRPFKVEVTNSAFGAVYAEINGEAHPVCDHAGYAPFGFGYRRCAGEFLTVGFVKDLLKKVSKEKIKFKKLTDQPFGEVSVAPATVVLDNICFFRK